jgi:hypothetical protein
VCFQAGPALVVDYQIGVVRVARIGRRALGGELALQGLPELTGRGGQAHLGAEAGQQLGGPGGADQLAGPAGV